MQSTQLQTGQLPKLFHVQTKTYIDLPQNFSIIQIGKPNDRIPPDIDVSHLPNSKFASRVHANIQVERGNYFIKDVGSSNGTYLNHTLMKLLTRYSLKQGDRIDFCKYNKLTFLFQLENKVPAVTSNAENGEEEQVALFPKLIGLGFKGILKK